MSSAGLTIVTFYPVVPLFILFFYVLNNVICKSYIQFEARIWHTFLSFSLILKQEQQICLFLFYFYFFDVDLADWKLTVQTDLRFVVLLCRCLLGAGIAGVHHHGCSIISLPFLSISVVSKPLHSLNCVLSNNIELFLKYFSQNMYLKIKKNIALIQSQTAVSSE